MDSWKGEEEQTAAERGGEEKMMTGASFLTGKGLVDG